MVVDESGEFVTQRTEARLALVKTELEKGIIHVQIPGSVPLSLPEKLGMGDAKEVKVWGDSVDAFVSRDASVALSDFLQKSVYLVSKSSERAVDQRYGTTDDRVSFADAFPILVTSQASLADLNDRLDAPITMERFRPNVVIDGGEAFEEEGWSRVTLGGVPYAAPKRCDRCVVTTIDPLTAEKGKEPLRTLAKYRRQEDGRVYFGMNLLPRGGEHELYVGDRLCVVGTNA